MNLIVGKRPLDAGKSETIDLICSKTGLKNNDIVLLLDIFSFFIRKNVVETGSAYITDLGRFFVKPNSCKLYSCTYHKVDFIACDDFKERIKGTKNSPVKQCSMSKSELKIVSDLFGIKAIDIKYLHKLFIFCISIFLKKYKTYRISRLGILTLVEKVTLRESPITKQWNAKNVNINLIKFKMSDPFFRELNRKTPQYFVYSRLNHMFVLSGINRNIIRKEYRQDYDYKKVPRGNCRSGF
jgi:nucleoid DNA-binding protein